MTMTHSLFAPHASLTTGWADNVLLQWDERGRLIQVQAHSTPDTTVPTATGPVVPGLPNLHSHAFQRAFAGLTEYRGQAQDLSLIHI